MAFFLERVPALRPRVVLEVPEVRHPRLRRWSEILARHGGGEGGHYFTEQVAQIWRQTPQLILRFPYAGVDFRNDPDIVLPPGEAFDDRGMCFVSVLWFIVFVFDILVHILMGRH